MAVQRRDHRNARLIVILVGYVCKGRGPKTCLLSATNMRRFLSETNMRRRSSVEKALTAWRSHRFRCRYGTGRAKHLICEYRHQDRTADRQHTHIFR
jgi:hypothetical protein